MAKHAIIIGNGEPPSEKLLRQVLQEGGEVYCADGGANILAAFGQIPDYIVGDLDSVKPEVLAQVDDEHQICIDADNTSTDLMKVLQFAEQRGVTHATLLAVTGRRIDHTLWNLSLLKTFRRRLQLRILDDYCDVRLIEGNIRFSALPGLKLSLCPIGGPAKHIRTRGLKYPLNDEVLEPAMRDGISNEVAENPVVISVGSGYLLLCIQREDNMGDITIEGEA
jgi:thiamine pyrophosphokinase